ncbi:MAG TPA: ELWxxDGT repeat protein [Thermoanaerobaculia bacterium]|nr:ELWxxDGT repeat protein [Thermoanaerobaculia bacterium]
MHFRAVRCLCLVLIASLLGTAEAHAQLAFKVKDLNTTKPRAVADPLMPDFATLGTTMLFSLDDGGTGRELWRLDGITGSAELLKDLCPGSCSSSPYQLTSVGSLVFFTANDGAHGLELWKSDGTAGGTVMVRDIFPGATSSFFGRFANLDGTFYFAANDGVLGTELWTSDGTAAGTRLVADINPGPGSSTPYIQASSQGKLFLTASDGSHGQEPWISDGTAAGTHLIRDLNPGPASSITFPYIFEGDETALGLADGTFVFGADDGVHGQEPWRTNGTDAGTVLIKDINPGQAGSAPISFALLGGKIYFGAGTADTGTELWVTDRTEAGTALVEDITPGTAGSGIARLTVANDRLFFGVSYRQVWVSDGTAAGTDFLMAGALLSLGNLGSSVLALTNDPFLHTDQRLRKTDGTVAGTVTVKNLGPQDSHCFTGYPDPREVDGEIFFYGCKRGSGVELWRSDGTPAGTVLVQAPSRTPSFPLPFGGTSAFLTPFGDRLIFPADDGISGGQLWQTDGTAAATQPVPGVPGTGDRWPELPIDSPIPLGGSLIYNGGNAGLLSLDGAGAQPLGARLAPSPGYIARSGDLLFFTSTTPAAGTELWKTDGTPAGTGIVKDVVPGSASSSPTFQGALGPLFYFSTNGDELWRTDGTEAGTLLLRDFWPGTSSTIQYQAVLGSNLLLVVVDDSQHWALWKTDGTPAGTVRVKLFDQGPSVFGATITGVTRTANRVFLRLDDGSHGVELWVSDGTEAGTRLLEDVRPGAPSSGIEWLSEPGESRLYFTADDGVHGRELWVSDGTDAGTRLLRDVRPGADSSVVEWLRAPGQNLVYFTADDGVHGRELWVSDGTEAGTRLLKDIRPGAEPAALGCCLAFVQNRFFFTADDGAHGIEVWVSDGTEAGTPPGQGRFSRAGILVPVFAPAPGAHPHVHGLGRGAWRRALGDQRHGNGHVHAPGPRPGDPVFRSVPLQQRAALRLFCRRRRNLGNGALEGTQGRPGADLRRRAFDLLGLALRGGSGGQRLHQRLRQRPLLPDPDRDPGGDVRLHRPGPARHGLRAAAGHRHPLPGRPRQLLGGALDRAVRRRRPHQRLRHHASALLPRPLGPPGPDGRLPAARPSRRVLRAAAGHRHGVPGRSRRLLGRRLDRAARRRGSHQRLRAEPLLPGQPGRARRDGRVPDPDVQPAAAVSLEPS